MNLHHTKLFLIGCYAVTACSGGGGTSQNNQDTGGAPGFNVSTGGAQATGGTSSTTSTAPTGGAGGTTGPSLPYTNEVKAIESGNMHACALLVNGTIRCWGSNSSGVLGSGSGQFSLSPVEVVGISTATMLSTKYIHACTVLSSGEARCWGDDGFDQLGNGSGMGSSTPVAVSGVTDAAAVAAGWDHTCALMRSGSVECWGYGIEGQLGDGKLDKSNVPVVVSNLSNAKAVTAGYMHTCAIAADDTVQCWGMDDYGQLGKGTPIEYSGVPAAVVGLTSVRALALGYGHSCALLSDATVWCWGHNDLGQLGNGTTTDSRAPVQVSGITNAVAIAADGQLTSSHSCALLSDGTVQCWGCDILDLAPNVASFHVVPVTIGGLPPARAISVGSFQDCVLLNSGKVMCWGANDDGQLGNGTTQASAVPVEVVGL